MAYRILSRIRRGLILQGALTNYSPDPSASPLPGTVETVLPVPQQIVVSDDILLRAKKALNGELTLWNRQVRFDPVPSWQTGPETGYAWPTSRPVSIAADAGPPGELRRVWELNRQHVLYDLGRAYLATGTEEYRSFGWQLIYDWIEKNAIEKGINWTSPLEMAIRVTAWLWFARMAGFDSVSEKHTEDVEAFILAMVRHTAWNLSLYPVANNHLAGEALLLIEAAALFPNHCSAARWGTLGHDLLVSVIDRQVLSDGSPAEQSPSYLLFTAEIYLLAHVILERAHNLSLLPSHVGQRLAAGLTFLAELTNGSSGLPAVGDSDDSMFMGWDRDPTARLSGLVQAGRVLLRQGIPSLATESQTASWLAGSDQGSAVTQMLSPQPLQRKDSGGWICLRQSGVTDVKVLFYTMPLGLPPLFGHGHAHALSVGLWIDGNALLVDPGTYTYAEEPWRTYFKGTRAHSTIEVEGKNQAESLDTFTWGSPYWCSGEIMNSDEALEAWGTHTGYLRLPQRVTHKRTLQLTRDRLRIEDVVTGQSCFRALLLWQIHPDWIVELKSHRESHLVRGDYGVCLVVDGPGTLTHISGTSDPEKGWFSPRFDELAEGNTLEVEAIGSEIRWTTEIKVKRMDG